MLSVKRERSNTRNKTKLYRRKKIMNILALVFVILGGISLTIGDLIMKKWIANGGLIIYVLGLVVYLVGMIFLSQSFRFKNIAVASMLLVIFNVVCLVIVSWIFYHEKLTWIQIVGILIGMLSVVLLEIE